MVAEPTRRAVAPIEPPAVRAPRGRVSRLVRLLPTADYRQVDAGFRRSLRATPALERHLAGAVGDLLAAPGSLVRAQLAYAVGRALGLGVSAARDAAVAVEYLHTASLVFDDLPAMDDASERRGRPCAHVRYGEGAAILAGLALVHRAHALVAEAAAGLPAARERRAWLRLEECVGLGGILDGQARDLHFRAGEDPLEVASGKTTPLLRLALLLPAALAGASAEVEAALDRLATAWGHAYQALDDFRDLAQSAAQSGKTARRDETLGRPNLVLAQGPERAFATLERELDAADDQLRGLAGAGDLAATLGRFTHLLEGESERVASRFAAGG